MDPLAPRIATVLSRLLTANTDPFSPTAGFCCSSAWSGTVNSPPANPSSNSAAAGQRIRRHRPEQGQRAKPHAERPERHQTQFHLVARPPPRRQASAADADGQARAHRRDAAIGQTHDLAAGRQHRHLQQRAEEPEPRHAQRRHPQRALAGEALHADGETRPRVPAQGRGVACRRDAGNADAHAAPTAATAVSASPMAGRRWSHSA